MKLGSFKEGGCDGMLIVVSCDFIYVVCVIVIVFMLQVVLDDWYNVVLCFDVLYDEVNVGMV